METNIRLNWELVVKEAIKCRKEQGFTQEKLAILVNLSKPTIVNFENMKTNIKIESALKILRFFGLD